MERDHERQAYSQRQSKVQYEHCPGYTDKYGIWNNGFNCPRWGGANDDYCCGNDRERFCCPPPQQHDNDDGLSLTTPFNNIINNNNNNNNNVMVVYPQDQPSPTVTVPVLMIATGAGIVLAIIVVIATVCLCCLFCRCCRNQKSKFFKPGQKVDLMNQEAAKISSAIETQAMTSSRPRTPSSVHVTSSRVVDISNFKESRFSFSSDEDIVNVDPSGIVHVGRWNGHGDSMKKSTRDLDFINLPPISDEREHPNFFNNDNFRLHESIMTTSDYHSSSPLTGQPNNTNIQHQHHHNNSNNNGNNSGSGSSSATLGRNQHHKQRCQLHQHHSSASSCLSPSQQQQVASIQSQGAMKRLTFDLLHSLSPGLQRHYVESGGKAEGHQSPYLGPKFN